MENKRKMLIGTDYSEASLKAERYALQLASYLGFTPVFIHVFEAPLSNPMAPFDADKVEYNPHVFEGNKLNDHVAGVYQSLNLSRDFIKPEYIVREGEAGTQILEETTESDIEMIVVGTHGVSGFREFFIGSHAWDVIKNASVPVLAIPDAGSFKEIQHIVFATDYRQGEIPAIQYLLHLADYVKARISIVHVNNPFLPQEIESLKGREFDEEIKEAFPDKSLKVETLMYDDIVEGLDDYCGTRMADWLVMSPEVPTLLEKIFVPNVSITRKMSFLTQVPLLAIPDYYKFGSEAFWSIYNTK